mmetsp:Transcript_31948/g.48864  ORF Transcript_31948/g.48864 Transcript_31948/m.48864 type:complete len:247 (-) Transcript_31948:384-1124(-)
MALGLLQSLFPPAYLRLLRFPFLPFEDRSNMTPLFFHSYLQYPWALQTLSHSQSVESPQDGVVDQTYLSFQTFPSFLVFQMFHLSPIVVCHCHSLLLVQAFLSFHLVQFRDGILVQSDHVFRNCLPFVLVMFQTCYSFLSVVPSPFHSFLFVVLQTCLLFLAMVQISLPLVRISYTLSLLFVQIFLLCHHVLESFPCYDIHHDGDGYHCHHCQKLLRETTLVQSSFRHESGHDDDNDNRSIHGSYD